MQDAGYKDLDSRDQALVETRMASVLANSKPVVGDYVRFADGIERRISYIWFDEHVQTSNGGSFYLGNEGCSFSGSLFTGVPMDSLTRTDESKSGQAWIFHHDSHRAHNGVAFQASFRVFSCSKDAPR